ncbi:Glutaconate CoA-transferase subunit B [bioreactor metagenome]|uniref:Glutaconate CoA-transferase subunit B n=1 Tax=bioreactor metagenome TaxID=1076179 RepID=A0A644WRC9_9ZZZZ
MSNLYYSRTDIQAYTIAKMIEEDQIVIVGTGLPLVGASLAKKRFMPSCNLIVESGLMGCYPSDTPRSVSDLRFMAQCMVPCPPYRYFGLQVNEWQHDTGRLIAFIGGASIDAYGNVGSTCIGDYYHPRLRLPGSGGANGIATYCNTIIMMQHDKRKFTEHVDYITSPGWIGGPGGREKSGLPGNRGPMMVISDLGVMKFDEKTKRMYLSGYYPFTTPEEIQKNTGFELDVSRAVVMEAPDRESVEMLHREIDPEGIYLENP